MSLSFQRSAGRVWATAPKSRLACRALSTRPQLYENATTTTIEGSSFYEAEFLSMRERAVRQSPQFKFPPKELSLQGFLNQLPATLTMRQEILEQDPEASEGKDDPVMALFRKLKLSPKDWAPYAHFDPTRAYTRNLIHTDHESFTLLLLCWNAGAESKIHDHPCDGCWLQVLQGEIQECRYEYPTEERGSLKCIADDRFREGQVAFINDSIGLHKVGNPCPHVPAVTLHLYSPPFQDCKVWDNSAASSAAQSSCSEHFSEYGRVL